MIEEINERSFRAYGRSLGQKNPRRELPGGEGWVSTLEHVTRQDNRMRMHPDAEVYLDYGQGTAMLTVALAANGDGLRSFYLDKPVCVRRGVYYCVLPLDESCDVYLRMPSGAEVRYAPLRPEGAERGIAPRMAIRGIRTLFDQEKEEGFHFRGESHPQYELTYMDKGSMHSIAGGRDTLLSAGEMTLYGPDQWHSQYAEPGEAVRFLTVSFDMDCEEADALLERKLAVGAQERALLEAMLEESRNPRPMSGDMICCLLGQFLVAMIRAAQSEVGAQDRATRFSERNENAIIDRALKYVSENLYEKLSVTGVARAANVCTSYLAILFSRRLGVSPGEYIRREKLEESKRLIRQGEMNLTQIADKLRYSSSCHFSNQFKRRYGITPSEYCRRAGAERD